MIELKNRKWNLVFRLPRGIETLSTNRGFKFSFKKSANQKLMLKFKKFLFWIGNLTFQKTSVIFLCCLAFSDFFNDLLSVFKNCYVLFRFPQ